MWIQEWIDNRFGVPNTVNKQVYEDFAEELMGKAREVIEGAGLTDEEIQKILDEWRPFTTTPMPMIKEILYAYLQAILRALGGE